MDIKCKNNIKIKIKNKEKKKKKEKELQKQFHRIKKNQRINYNNNC